MKKINIYIYEGLGFPVKLSNVPMVEINGELHPKIDVRRVADSAMKSLVLQKERLTGNQVKFIRHYFSMSLRKFGKLMNESHMSIKKWEDFKEKSTNMDKNIEIVLRLHILDKMRPVRKIRNNDEFHKGFSELKSIFSRDPKQHEMVPPLELAQ